MQSEYDAWYEEGYGDSPAPPHNELGYPNRKWVELNALCVAYAAYRLRYLAKRADNKLEYIKQFD